MNPETKDLDTMEEHNDKCFKDGILKEYNIEIPIKVNGNVVMYKKTFIHNTLNHTPSLWNDMVALEVGEDIERLIKENNMLF